MLTIIIRTLLIYIFVIIAVRIMGKRQVADMQTTELVTTLIISEVASLPMQNTNQPLLSGFVPILLLVAIEIIISIIMMKSRRFRTAVIGHPIIVIRDGVILKEQLKRLRISFEDLYSLLRQQEVFDLKEVRYGIIEPNGSLSILSRSHPDSALLKSSRDIEDELNKIEEKEETE